jgi:hypothetical protein
MSALPPQADISWLIERVRFGPVSDMDARMLSVVLFQNEAANLGGLRVVLLKKHQYFFSCGLHLLMSLTNFLLEQVT